MPPSYDPTSDPARVKRFNEILREVARERPELHLVDFAKWMEQRPGGVLDPTLRPDGVHLAARRGRDDRGAVARPGDSARRGLARGLRPQRRHVTAALDLDPVPPATSTPSRARRGSGYIPALDGIRGVAVLLVFLFHVGSSLVDRRFPRRVGVLHALGLPDHDGSSSRRAPDDRAIDLIGFWARRLRRLLPASLLAILLVLVLSATAFELDPVGTPGRRAGGARVRRELAVPVHRPLVPRPVLRRRHPSSTTGASRSRSSSICSIRSSCGSSCAG